VFPILMGVSFELAYTKSMSEVKPKMSAGKKKIAHLNEEESSYSEEPYLSQVTSVPEKQVGDE
jgi:hypothetical protein